MFEYIVRPSQTQPVLATTRIVKSVSIATGATAILSWGVAGAVPAGARQLPPKVGSQTLGGFSVTNAVETWSQTDPPVTEDVQIEGVTIKRVREITFHTIVQALDAQPFSLAAEGVTDVVAGLLRDMPGNRTKQSTYKTKWN
jgi:hypothetical protein